ncbi:FtsX-like permease family protein [Bacillus massiliigorillae]|uniref:FtsX-like permease family protein n=1 Tax=Bacillus massiliigorillae TaxID=1243664 RepID=UPI0003A92435|nr:ABC transporter permease [Bacillus massiliigorillae]
MNFRQFALTNVKRNTRSYAAYFLSSVFSITIFFIYAAFIFHPDVLTGSLSEKSVTTSLSKEALRSSIILAESIIFSFSFLFVLYSMNAFLQSRKKEFGILNLLGITNGQLNKLIFIENNVIGITAIVTGIGFGMLFFKLFLMGVSAVLSLPVTLPFIIAPKALYVTIGAFLILFEVICFLTLFTVRFNNVTELLYSIKKPKKSPTYSVWLSLVALTTIGTGYYLAYTANLFKMIIFMVPITLLVTFGTYFLFTQCSILFIRLLKKNRAYYLRSTNLLTFSDLAFKLKDNARVLFIVSIISAVSFTSSGVLFSLVSNMKDETVMRYPQSIALATSYNIEGYNITKKQLTNALQDTHLSYEAHEMKLLKAWYLLDKNNINTPFGINTSPEKEKTNILLLSQSDYNIWAKLTSKEPLSLDNKQAIFVASTPDPGIIWYNKDYIKIEANQHSYTFSIRYMQQPILSPSALTGELLVIHDSIYEQIATKYEIKNIITIYGIHLPNWEKDHDAVVNISKNLKLDKGLYFDSRANMINEYKSMFYLPFFIGLFISCLFFLAAASILYFRLYNDIDNELLHYRSLFRMGLTPEEMKSIISKQIFLLFFVPFIVAVTHASFAVKALHNMINGSVLGPSLTIFGIFFSLQLVYFFAVRAIYFKKLKQVM